MNLSESSDYWDPEVRENVTREEEPNWVRRKGENQRIKIHKRRVCKNQPLYYFLPPGGLGALIADGIKNKLSQAERAE